MQLCIMFIFYIYIITDMLGYSKWQSEVCNNNNKANDYKDYFLLIAKIRLKTSFKYNKIKIATWQVSLL